MRFLFKFSCLAALMFGSMTIVSAQYVVSAKAGLVNYVERRVTITHVDGGTERARVGAQLENGDIVDAQGRLEILLNPGATLRLEKGSTLKVIETDFEKMQFELDAGAALIEATKDMGTKHGLGLEIATREATLVVQKYGLYEISASPAGSTVVMVHKGNGDVKIAGRQTVDLKGGHQITVNSSAVAEAKIGKASTSDFQMWGQERAETLAALNNRIDTRDTLVGQRSSLSGAWVYSRFWGSYVYMPYNDFYTSPYGYWYGSYYDPYYWGNRGYVGPSGGSGGSGSSGRPTAGAKGSVAGATGNNGQNTSGPVKHNPSGDRPSPTGGGRGATTTASTRVSPGPTHAYSGGGGGGYTRGSAGGGGSYGGGGGTYSGGTSAPASSGGTVSAPSAPSAPSKGSGGSSAPAGGVGRARGN